jgi:hypothetical protein
MDTRERIEAVRRRLRDMQSDERWFEASGPPCYECAHYSRWLADERLDRGKKIPSQCRHLALTNRTFDLPAGVIREKATYSTDQARSEEGLCGPEAILFEPLPKHKTALRRLNRALSNLLSLT